MISIPREASFSDATEETQYFIAGAGEFYMEDDKYAISPGRVFAIPANVRHDLANTGTTTFYIIT
jgi:mannose-6-phosphate isomerase-like protein (cupin superfamily)